MAQQDEIQWVEEEATPDELAQIQWVEEDAPAPAQVATPASEEPVGDPSIAADIGREIGAGAVAATGYALEGFGEASRRAAAPIAAGLNWAFDTNFFRSENVLSGASKATDKYSKDIEAEQSAEWRKAKAGAQITGDLTDPSTWSWGKDPSLKGFAAQTLNVLGQAGPMAALAVATRGQGLLPQLTATGIVGAATTVGAGRSEIRTEVESMSPQQLQSESALYRDRISQGDTSVEARQKVIDTVSDDSFWKLAGIGGLGGFATGYVLGGAAKKLGANAVARAGMEGLGEGTEELLEGVAKNDAFGAAGIKKDLMEGSFGNLVMGAAGGATTAGALAVAGREVERVRDLTSRTETRRQEAAEAGEDALSQELAAGTGQAEDINEDAARPAPESPEDREAAVRQIQARNDLIERVAGGAEPSIAEAAPEAPLPPAAATEAAAALEMVKLPDLDPTKEPGMVQIAAELDPDALDLAEIPGEIATEQITAEDVTDALERGRPERAEQFAELSQRYADQLPEGEARHKAQAVAAVAKAAVEPTPEVPTKPEKVDTLPEPVKETAEPIQVEPTTAATPLPHTERDSAPVDSWVELDDTDMRGKPVAQIREVPIDELYMPELDETGRLQPEKRKFEQQYADRLEAGEVAPRIDVIEMEDGRLRVVDGHRRAAAAKLAGQDTIEAVVSPLIDLPGEGKVTLTKEIAPKQPAMEAKKAERAEAAIEVPLAPKAEPTPVKVPTTPVAKARFEERAKADKRVAALKTKQQASKEKAAERAQAKVEKGKEAKVAKKEAAMAAKRATLLKKQEIDAAAAEAQTSPDNDLPAPTEDQIKAGTYKKGHVSLHGLDITIENPKGSLRTGKSADGRRWSTRIKDHYGYIKRTEGADGDHVDVFLGPNIESDRVYVVDQVNPKSGKFDEHKVIMGAKTSKQALAIYKRNYARGWKGSRQITPMTLDEFKTWLKEGDTTKAVKPLKVDKAPPKPPVAKAPPAPPAPKAEPAFEAPTEKFTDYIRRRLQDKMHPLRQTQAEIAKGRGVEALPDELDALQAEESFYGKAEEHLRKLKDNLVRPLTEQMASRNISQAELDLYLMAQHAEERNEAIAEINPDMPDGGSGMTTAQADAILDRIEIDNRTADFEATSQYVYDILQAQRDTLKEAGLEVGDMVEVWEAKYENYVPLKGHAQGEPDAKGSTRRAGSGFDIRGKETLRALGRRSLAESPMINSIIDSTAAITRAEKNKVGNVFLRMVEQNPNPEYWEVFTASKPDVKRGVKLVDGAETVALNKVVNMGSDKYFSTKLEGVEYKVKINDERLLRAMQNLGPEPLGPVLKHLGSVTRFLSSMHTTYNPEFVISNVARDVQTAVLNVLAEQDIPGGRIKHEKIAGKMVKGIPVAVRAINASLHGKPLTGKAAKWQKVYEQFRESGAQTGWFDQKDFEGQAKELQSMLTEAQGGVKGNAKKFGRTVADVVHHFNTAIENGVRLSAFKAAIEAGVSEQKAASMAKNLTVNFNRKGEWGNILNTAFMFANASIQGTATFLRAMATMSKDIDTGKRKINPAQKVAAGMAAASFGLATLNRMMAGEDEDDVNWYDKVPQHVRERNIVMMKSTFGGEEGEYYTFPLPYAYNIFHVLGDQAESVVSGAKEPTDAALNITASLLGSFSPIGINLSDEPEKGVARTITPTVLSPVMQLAINENFFGSAIYRENMAFGAQYPDSALGKPKTAEHWKAVSKWLNQAFGGGEEFIPGTFDVNPDSLKFLAEFVGGGAGAFVVRSGDLAQKMFTGQEVEPHEIPFKRKLMGKVRPFEDLNKFYERRVEIGQHELQADSYQSKMEQRKYRRENEGILGMKGLAKRTGKKLSHLRKRRLKIRGNDRLTEVERDKQIKQLDREAKGAVDKFNKAYDAATKK